MTSRERLFTFRSGGWVLLVAGAISIGLVAFWIVPQLTTPHPHLVGDGQSVLSYGFDLANLLVSRTELAAAGIPKDGLPALDDPRVITAAEADAISREERGKYLVPADRVVGIEIGGEARAYPVRVLNWHEVVNDTIRGRPVVVTYSPLGDTVVVFDRQAGGETLRFGVPGLVWNSNTLVYDRRSDGGAESLWCPLQFRAVSGPRAGTALAPIPHQLTTWATWRAHHPETTVLWPDPRWKKRYKGEPYRSYYGSDVLRFPVQPLPGDGRALKTPVAIVSSLNGPVPVFVPEIGSGGPTEVAGARFTPDEGGRTAWAEGPVIAHAFWFAWNAARR